MSLNMRSAAAKGNRFKVLADVGGAGVVPSGMMTRQRAKKTYLEAASAQLDKRLSLKRATDHSAPKVSVGSKASVTTSPDRPERSGVLQQCRIQTSINLHPFSLLLLAFSSLFPPNHEA